MGRVKELSIWLADCVYQQNMSDETIIACINSFSNEEQSDTIHHWLKAQIQVVRNNPHLYSPFLVCDSSTSGGNSTKDNSN